MYQTIQLSSCVTIQGEFVEALANGEVVVRDGKSIYRGKPIPRPILAARSGTIERVGVPSPEAV